MNKLSFPDLRFFATRFIVIFLLLIATFSAIFYYDSISEMSMRKSNLEVQQNALLKGKKEYIEWSMGSVVKETALLSDILSQRKIYQIANIPDAEMQKAALAEFGKVIELISNRKEIYDQIRYLDLDGNEIIRVNFNEGRPNIVAQHNLQNKHHRYYFQEVVGLKCRRIYISPLDLNMEHGQIEMPFKPMIRFSTPVFNEKGEKQGVVIINYLAKYLLDGLQLFNLNSGTNYMLVNNDGQFLYNDLKPELEFGFMFNKQDANIYAEFPSLAKQIKETQQGQFETDKGIMTIQSVGSVSNINPYCFQEYHVSNNSSTRWKLVSFSAFDKRIDFKHALKIHYGLILQGTLLSVLIAYLLARYQLQQYRDDKRIHHLAHYDALTNLHNRWSFRHQSEARIQLSAKKGQPLCLIYIDLDDFKAINDVHGHAAGDKTLCHAAQTMRTVFGESALLSRLGGDEFAILLHDEQHLENPAQYAASLIQMLQCPIEVAPQVYCQVNASIGGYFDHLGQTAIDELMHQADMAMYQAKHAGKNRAVITSSTQPSGSNQPQ
ncbi:hypothetical protein VII00023_05937 [Vibrio ichthyoenteri ATCC 700023]|uniref:GGDEF domain-containing protein n=1 Tax=Vibrio ichthyoenteri ATCC 700023 TaxID=870968 RepID=F9S2S3_9VIBR|nr:sensor domain-containing diguanylate cyclase [Vibrio ichthyoenteri]EGU38847.1 hypothetical protein VII00023_05937 [Vibrio ichthyoenteri ATCC 700023]